MYVLTAELQTVLREFIEHYDLEVERTQTNWNKRTPGSVEKLSGREYVAIKAGMDPKAIYSILHSSSFATDFDKADKILCGIEMQAEFHMRVPIYEGCVRHATP